MEALGYFAAVVMGISLGLIGGGGSILTVPILVYFFAQDPLLATTNSLLVVGACALLGAGLAARRGQIDLATGALFAAPSFVGVFVARKFIIPALPDPVLSLSFLTLSKAVLVMTAFATLMVVAATAMIRSKPPTAAAAPKSRQLVIFESVSKGFLVGMATGFVGAGGGFLIIPALVLLLGMPMKKAVGTSLAIIAVNSLFGFTVSQHTDSNWTPLMIITALGLGGIVVGQKLTAHVPEVQLKKGFGVFVLVVGGAIFMEQIVKMLS
ncbi:MAG: sulfite exporter TauE/SafE family protein [Bdellovibrionales bacterium]